MGMVTYEVEGCLLACVPSRPAQCSFLFICPECGRQWASIVHPGKEFFPQRAACAAHEWAGGVPGSIASSLALEWVGPTWQMNTIELMPKDVLKYELEVHMKYHEKGVPDGN